VVRHGYQVTDIDDTGDTIDAIIYSASLGNNDYRADSTDIETGGNNKFVAMINADEKSVEEIISMLGSIRGY
jgi:hypothetical protein